MWTGFFISRPIFSGVCSAIILLLGLLALRGLPIAEYPNIAPPQVRVTAVYTGADAQTVEAAVTAPLEQEINGVSGMKYLTSTSGNDGTSSIIATFDLARDVDLAAVDVQNRVSTVLGRLPEQVRARGISVDKVSSNYVLVIGLTSDRHSQLFLSNYADLYLRDALKRVSGVGDVVIYGERKYAMRVWLDPRRLAERKLTADEVLSAIRGQNVEVGSGQLGQAPMAVEHLYVVSLRTEGRLTTPGEFSEIVLAADSAGRLTKLKDVGRVELGAEDYSTLMRYNGKETVGLGIYSRPGANALDLVRASLATLEIQRRRFPAGMDYRVAIDTTRSVHASLHEVVQTLVEAIVLVIFVMFVFLQDWRATLIPAITLPLSLIGTFAVLRFLGYWINTLTLFGLTLATGLVVDDAIVVVENIARQIGEGRLQGRAAATFAMREVTGAVIATSLVLGAIFIPATILPGSTGVLYRQFAVSIAASVGISAFVALTLTPALSALFLREHSEGGRWFAWFNRSFEWSRRRYDRTLGAVVTHPFLAVTGFVVLLGCTAWLALHLPSGFLPDEDQAFFIITAQGPEGTSMDYTLRTVKRIENELQRMPEVTDFFAVTGFNFTGNGANKATVWVSLRPWEERRASKQSAGALVTRLQSSFATITDATVLAFNPPSVQGIGNLGGFQFEIEDLSDHTITTLDEATGRVVRDSNASAILSSVYTTFRANNPQLVLAVDRDKAQVLGVDVSQVFNALQVSLGAYYVNDFDQFHRTYRVFVQADAPFRSNTGDIGSLYVRSRDGHPLPLGTLLKMRHDTAPQTILHYNLYRSTEVVGSPASGHSSGEAMAAMERIARKVLPQGISFEWSGLSREEREAGSQTTLLLVLGTAFVFLILAAQYESLRAPLIILLATPVALFGGLLFQSLRGAPIDIFCQIGLLMLIGIASKNGILIVEFANGLRTQLAAAAAVREAARLRLRPILMTSFAFVLGAVPLWMATGAGSAARRSIGTTVIGGMLLSTFLNLYLVPALYVVLAPKYSRDAEHTRAENPEGPQA